MNTPVLILFFNRDTVLEVVRAVREVQPVLLLLASDGPRADRPGEAETVARLREEVEALIDWPCEVHRFYREENLGCGLGPAIAITEAFAAWPEIIILEDDCVPEPTFFPYCEELLSRYRDDTRVWLISGQAFIGAPKRRDADYFFSRYPYTWGWATWRRAWAHFDLRVSSLEATLAEGWLDDVFEDAGMRRIWRRRFEWVKDFRDPSIWDFQWFFACMANGGLSASPYRNLVRYVGFGPEATHTFSRRSFPVADPEPLRFPLLHPRHVVRDRLADQVIGRRYYGYSEILFQIRAFGRRITPAGWRRRLRRWRQGG